MNAEILLNQFNDTGVIVQVMGDRLRLDAPVGFLTPERLKDIQTFKHDLLLRLAQHKKPSKAFVWSAVVDGRCLTIIDPDRLSLEEMSLVVNDKFGMNRVSGISRKDF